MRPNSVWPAPAAPSSPPTKRTGVPPPCQARSGRRPMASETPMTARYKQNNRRPYVLILPLGLVALLIMACDFGLPAATYGSGQMIARSWAVRDFDTVELDAPGTLYV